MKNRAVIYARYSSDKQREESIEGQLKICHEFATKNNLEVIREYIDRAKSGTKANRTEFQRMIMDSSSHKFEYVILYKTDRFARNEHDSIVNEHFLMSNGVELLYATQPFLNNRGGRIIKAVFRVQDEEYSINLSERTKLGLLMNIEKGNVVTGHCPIGYKVENKKMIIDPSTSHIPKIVFEMYSVGATTTEINNKLISIGEKPFHVSSINKMIRNKKYIGTLTYNGKTYEDYHPALIDKSMFELANLKIENRLKHGSRSTEEYLLSGFLFDTNGKHYRGNSGINHDGVRYRYYSLGKRYIKKEVIEKAVVESLIDTITASSDSLAKIVSKKMEQKVKDDSINEYRSQLTSVDKEIANIVKAIKMGITNESVKDELDTLEKKRLYLQSQINSAKLFDFSLPQLKMAIDKMKKRHLTENDKMSLIRTFVDKIIMREHHGIIYYKVTGQNISFEDIKSSDEIQNGAIGRVHPNIQAIVNTGKYIYLTSSFTLN